jgi:copper resistance protein B
MIITNLGLSLRPYKKLFSLLVIPVLLTLANPVIAGGKDDPLLTMVLIDQLEVRNASDDNPLVLEGQAWVGKDLNKLWFKTEFEQVDGVTEEAELQVLYSQAMAPYWDFQVGLRQDFKPKPERSWAVIGFQGVAPYFFEVDTALFIGESGRAALRLEMEYELMFTQQLILTPEIEVNLHGQNDKDLGAGSGLSDIELGLRLRYEVYREFAPYIGLNWSKKFGKTADFSRLEGEGVSDTQFVIGVRAWF